MCVAVCARARLYMYERVCCCVCVYVSVCVLCVCVVCVYMCMYVYLYVYACAFECMCLHDRACISDLQRQRHRHRRRHKHRHPVLAPLPSRLLQDFGFSKSCQSCMGNSLRFYRSFSYRTSATMVLAKADQRIPQAQDLPVDPGRSYRYRLYHEKPAGTVP